MDFFQLPEPFLTRLFASISLQERLSLQGVSTQFRRLLVEHSFSTQRSLKLFPSIEDLEAYIYTLKGHNLERATSPFTLDGNDDLLGKYRNHLDNLSALLPAIECLTIVQASFPHLKMDQLSQLSSLTLVDSTLNASAFQTLDKLQNLKCLHLFNATLTEPLPQILPFLSQLTEFSLCDFANSSFPILKHLGSSLERLMLRQITLTTGEMEKVFGKGSILAENVTQLNLGEINFENVQSLEEDQFYHKRLFELICRYFKKLEKFTFSPRQIQLNFEEIFTKLRTLKSLKFLELENSFLPNTQKSNLSTLKSIESLTLLYNEFSTESFPESSFLPLFPNLEVLHIFAPAVILQQAESFLGQLASEPEGPIISLEEKSDSPAPYMGRHRARFEEQTREDLARIRELAEYLSGLEIEERQDNVNEYDAHPANSKLRFIFIDYTNMFNV